MHSVCEGECQQVPATYLYNINICTLITPKRTIAIIVPMIRAPRIGSKEGSGAAAACIVAVMYAM